MQQFKRANIISIYSWQHPQRLPMYDPFIDEEIDWMARQLYKKLYPHRAKGVEEDEKRMAEKEEAKRPKGPFVPRIVKSSTEKISFES